MVRDGSITSTGTCHSPARTLQRYHCDKGKRVDPLTVLAHLNERVFFPNGAPRGGGNAIARQRLLVSRAAVAERKFVSKLVSVIIVVMVCTALIVVVVVVVGVVIQDSAVPHHRTSVSTPLRSPRRVRAEVVALPSRSSSRNSERCVGRGAGAREKIS
jgi:hypothetical protein